MPVIIYKTRINGDELDIAFDCKYNKNNALKLKNHKPNYFDSGDFRIKVEEASKKLNENILNEYIDKNHGVYCLAILNYFLDEIPSIYSIKFKHCESESIYYSSELKNSSKF